MLRRFPRGGPYAYAREGPQVSALATGPGGAPGEGSRKRPGRPREAAGARGARRGPERPSGGPTGTPRARNPPWPAAWATAAGSGCERQPAAKGGGGAGAERPSGGSGVGRGAVPPPSRMRAREATLRPAVAGGGLLLPRCGGAPFSRSARGTAVVAGRPGCGPDRGPAPTGDAAAAGGRAIFRGSAGTPGDSRRARPASPRTSSTAAVRHRLHVRRRPPGAKVPEVRRHRARPGRRRAAAFARPESLTPMHHDPAEPQDQDEHTSCTSRPCRLTSGDMTTPQATHSVVSLRRSQRRRTKVSTLPASIRGADTGSKL